MTIRRFDVTEDRVFEYEVYGDMVQDSSGAYVLFEDYHASHAYDEAKEREMFEAYASDHYRLQELPLCFDDGEYFDTEVQYSWESWQACAKSRARSAE